MTQKDKGGPAFPTEPRGPLYGSQYDGMTLRDYFAGQALAGLLSGPPNADFGARGYAIDAYDMADAMLAERSK